MKTLRHYLTFKFNSFFQVLGSKSEVGTARDRKWPTTWLTMTTPQFQLQVFREQWFWTREQASWCNKGQSCTHKQRAHWPVRARVKFKDAISKSILQTMKQVLIWNCSSPTMGSGEKHRRYNFFFIQYFRLLFSYPPLVACRLPNAKESPYPQNP